MPTTPGIPSTTTDPSPTRITINLTGAAVTALDTLTQHTATNKTDAINRAIIESAKIRGLTHPDGSVHIQATDGSLHILYVL
jgi:hypothetical protein